MKNYYKSLKTLALLLMAGFFMAGTAFAEEHSYGDSWGKQGFQLTQQKGSGVEITYSIQNFYLNMSQFNGENMAVIELPGNLLQNDEGAPNLPGTGRFIAIPQGATATLEVVDFRTELFKNVEMSPAPRIPWDTETGPLEYNKNLEIFNKDAFYPENPVMLSAPTQIRGVDVVTLGITPFQYNPVTKELIVYRDLKVKVNFEGGSDQFGEDRLRSRWFDPLLADMLLNYESLPKGNYNHSMQGTDETGCEYLIVCPDAPEFLQWADSIKKFRTMQGILTDIRTTAEIGGNNWSTIETYFNNAYATWDIPPVAVLILGDYGTSGNTVHSPTWNNYCASDNIYADVNNNDMPDMVFARMTAQNATQLETMITKFLNYERTPPTDPYFYNHPITALGFQTERWFQICSESVAGFWENELGKSTVRINKTYAGNPTSDPWSTATNTATVLNIFGPNGLGYIPATPGAVNCTWNGSGQDVVNAINAGSFMLQHRDHGYEQGWGEPGFTSSNINSLNNTDLVFIWSINCLTGKYQMSGECFAEKFHRYTYNGENSGCLGMNAASEVSYSFVNDTYVWGSYDNMWPDFLPDYGSTPEERGILPAFGMTAGKYFLQQSSWPYNTNNKEVTYNLFHHHGDAFMTVFSEVPEYLTVTHNPILYAGVTSFDITANAGALIAFTVNGEIIATAEATGGPLSVTIPPQQPPDAMVITITLQNHYRYSETVDVIPPSGPYIVQNAIVLNDAAGNGNGIMETSESILASLTIENVGIEVASGVSVTLTTGDAYVTLTDDTEVYGDVAAGATASVTDGFAWDVADNIPDMHLVIFECVATDGNETWSTFLSVQGHGPNLEVGSMTIDDSNGNNNGRLDPGEDVIIIIETTNSGSFDAAETIGALSIPSSFVTINNDTYDFNVLGTGLTETAAFSITIANNAPIGTSIALIYNVTSGGYSAQENFAANIGLIVEDWETGDMGQFDWVTGGNNDWQIVNSGAYEGTYCAKSGVISHNQDTYIEMVYEVATADVISFAYKVSSESNYDYLKFYIDGNNQGSWAGEVAWTEIQVNVGVGEHTFTWEYMKDGSVSNGGDCAWIDFIILPAGPVQVMTAYAGIDDESCGTAPYQMQGVAALYDVVMWTTTGTGSFDNATSLDANYTPSEADVISGAVTLTLTAYQYPSTEISDEMVLTLFASPEAYAGEDATTYGVDGFELSEATAENYVSVMWSTSGDGTFDDTGIINPIYTPGTVDLENGIATLTFDVTGEGVCEDASDDMELTIETVGISERFNGFDFVLFPNPNTGSFALELNGNTEEKISIRIYNALGAVVYNEENITVKQSYAKTINLDVEQGVYYIRIEGKELLINKKVIIRK